MSVNNSLSKQQPSFPAFIKSEGVMRGLVKTLGSETKKSEFVSSVISAVQTNPNLQKCEFNSIINAALLGHSLKLAHSPQLGQYYMVPYGNQAQFQMGYKGYIQLALRTGQYKKINVLPIKEGELVMFDPLNEEIEVSLIEDELERENAQTIGYYAMFEYLNGFRKVMYWTKQKMEAHASKYSKGYQAKKGYTYWEKDFDGMACKTMIRQLISKWGVMSLDFQKAYEKDMATIHDDGSVDYIDNPNDEYKEVKSTIKDVVDVPKQTVQQEDEQITLL